MLKGHLDAVENHLLAISRIPAGAGHPLHKGTPREAFIKEFLDEHLSRRVAVGTGEIIDADSAPGEQRKQIDIILCKPEYPRLHFGAETYAFLAESAIATIEVKSVLTKDELRHAFETAQWVKVRKRSIVTSFTTGYYLPRDHGACCSASCGAPA